MSEEKEAVVPDWAEKWARGRCGCGSRLVHVDCSYCDGHVVCAATGWDTVVCPRRPETEEGS